MSNLPWTAFRAIDNSGVPINGAKLYFYAATTLTPKNTYSDESLSSLNSNPLTSTSDGYFGETYLMTDGAYKIVLKDASLNTLKTWDNINAVSLYSANLVTRVKQIASNPLDYSAAGDGTTNDATAIASAISNATGIIDLLGKTYRCDSGLVLTAGKTLRNGTLDFSQAASPPNNHIAIQGSHGSTVALTSNAAFDATAVIVTSTSGLSAGDWIYITSSATWGGETAQIDSISGTTINLRSRLLAAYNTADSAAIRKMSTVDNVTLESLRIITNSSGSGTGRVIFADTTTNLVLRDVLVDGIKLAGVQLDSCIGTRIENCVLSDNNTTGGAGIVVGNHSYDVSIDRCSLRSASVGIVINDDAGALLSGPAGLGGITQGVRISNCRLDHPNGSIGGYGITTGTVGAQALAMNVSITNCEIVSSGTVTYGVYYSGQNFIMSGCQVRNADVTLELATTIVSMTDRVFADVSDNILHSSALSITGSSGARGALIVGRNRVYGANATVSTNNADAVISANNIRSGRLIVTAAGKTTISSNLIAAAAGNAALTVTGNANFAVAITGNVAHSTNNRAASFTECDGTAITGNMFTRDDDIASCVLLTNCDDFTLCGNVVNNGTYGFEFVTCTGGLHDGNTFLGQATGTTTGAGVTAGDSA